ncbi:hypothetical protein Hdeb2414_s0124g00804201 [Helianthus debilis subsp. tardiflorus]
MSLANTSGKRRRIVSSYETGETSSAPPRRRMSQRLHSITSQTTESSGSMRRPLPSYSDCGDCTYICEHCNALFWFNERVLHAAHVRHPRYNQCCKSGAVSTEEGSCYSIRLYNNVPDRRYGAPSPDTLGGIVCRDDFNASGYDIIIHSKGGIPQRVSVTTRISKIIFRIYCTFLSCLID